MHMSFVKGSTLYHKQQVGGRSCAGAVHLKWMIGQLLQGKQLHLFEIIMHGFSIRLNYLCYDCPVGVHDNYVCKLELKSIIHMHDCISYLQICMWTHCL